MAVVLKQPAKSLDCFATFYRVDATGYGDIHIASTLGIRAPASTHFAHAPDADTESLDASSPMVIIKNLSLMAVGTGIRLVAGVITLAVTARALGPVGFGLLMFWMSVAGLAGVLSNFGLGTYLLREIGRTPEMTLQLISESLSAKLMLSLLVMVMGFAFVPVIAEGEREIFLLLLTAMLIEGYADFFCAGFRARDRFDVDARAVAVGAAVNGFVVSVTAILTRSVVAVAAAYLVSRSLVAVITYGELSRVLGRVRPAGIGTALHNIRRTYAYAIDAGMGSLFGQVDSLVLNHYLGAASVGVYQAGMRLFLAGQQGAAVISNVFLPRASASAYSAEKGAIEQRRVQLAFLVVGGVGGLVFFLGAELLVHLIFGDSFHALVALMPWFGTLFILRFVVAGWGILLTAQGYQRFRAVASVIHWAAIGLSSLVLVPTYGNTGWLLALIAGNVLLLPLYVFRMAREGRLDTPMIFLSTIIVCGFIYIAAPV